MSFRECALCEREVPTSALDAIAVVGGELPVCVWCLTELDEVAEAHRTSAWEAQEDETAPLPWEAAWTPEHALVSEDRPIARPLTARVA